MITEVQFKQDIRCFKSGDIVPFRDGVNVIVGANGCGKSTLIELVRSRFATYKARQNAWRSMSFTEVEASKIITVKLGGYSHVIGYDFERDSGRSAPDIQYEKFDLQMYEARHSHGEASIKTLDTLIMPLAQVTYFKKEKLSIWLDEPDANLSPRSAYKLVRYLREMANFGHQVIVTAHNPIVVTGQIPGDGNGWTEVFDMESRKWMAPNAFLESQAKQ